MFGFLADLPGVAVLGVVAVLLVLEAGLLIGVLLPGGSAVIAVGAVSGSGAVPLWSVILTAALASVMGGLWGLSRGRRAGGRPNTAAVPTRIHRWIDRLNAGDALPGRATRGWRTSLTAGLGQGFGGLRTLVPRLAGARGTPVRSWLLGAVPAALLWAGLLALGGSAGSAAVGAIESMLPAALAVLVLVAIGGAVVVRRRGGKLPAQ